jgi:hypothetical protein
MEPAPATRYRRDERSAGLGANRSTVAWRQRSRHDNIASPPHRHLPPWDAQNQSITVRRVGQIAGCLCLQLHCQLVCLDLDTDDVIADEVSVTTFCGILEMLADGASDERLDLRRRHPAHGSGTPRLPMQQGRRDVISISDAKLTGMAGAHSVAAVIIDAIDQECVRFGARGRVIGPLVIEFGLHRVEEVTIEDSGLLPGHDLLKATSPM